MLNQELFVIENLQDAEWTKDMSSEELEALRDRLMDEYIQNSLRRDIEKFFPQS